MERYNSHEKLFRENLVKNNESFNPMLSSIKKIQAQIHEASRSQIKKRTKSKEKKTSNKLDLKRRLALRHNTQQVAKINLTVE